MDVTQWANSNELLQSRVPGTTQKIISTFIILLERGTVHQELVDRFKALLSSAAMQFLNHDHNCFVEFVQSDESAIRQSLQFSEVGKATNLNIKNKMHIIAFKYPVKGHIYLGFRCQAFSKFACSLQGSVHDCYFLHFKVS